MSYVSFVFALANSGIQETSGEVITGIPQLTKSAETILNVSE